MAKNKDLNSNQISYRIGYRRGRADSVNAVFVFHNVKEPIGASNPR